MADLNLQNYTVNQPNNTNFTTQIPGEGVLFRTPGGASSGADSINKIIGDTVYSINPTNYKGDLNGLPEFHPDVAGNVLKGGRQVLTDYNQFQGLQPKGTPTSSGTSGNQPLPPGVSSYNAPTMPPQNNAGGGGSAPATKDDIQALLQRGDKLGADASKLTNIPYTPVAATPPALPTPATEKANIDTTNNNEQKQNAETLTKVGGVNVDTSESSLLQKVFNNLSSLKEPAVPNRLDKYNAETVKLGTDAVQTKINDVNSQLAKMEGDYKATLNSEDNRLVSMFQIGRRETQITKDYNAAKAGLEATKNSLTNELNTKLSTINTIMTLTGQDYADSKANYDDQFSKNIQLIDLFQKIDTANKSQANVIHDNNLADAQVLMNHIQNGSLNPATFSPEMKASLTQKDLALGWPPGTIASVSRAIKDPITTTAPEYTDANNNRILPIITKTQQKDGTWKPSIQTFVLPGSTSGTYSANKPLVSNGVTISNNALQAGTQSLSDSMRKSKDGYADTQLYLRMYDQLVRVKHIKPQDFLKQFPPNLYLNPNDPTIPPIIQTKMKGVAPQAPGVQLKK
jgi:hypothetical protein